jgi:hypothetical protein
MLMMVVHYKVYIAKTKIMVTGKKNVEKVQSGKYPCGVCGRGVEKKE